MTQAEIKARCEEIEAQLVSLSNEFQRIQEMCQHPGAVKKEVIVDNAVIGYQAECPDCTTWMWEEAG